MTTLLRVLAVDDEAPALDELTYLLGRHADVGEVVGAATATSALRAINDRPLDAVFLDINMPGLSGLELAGLLTNFANPPAVVFVTAHEDRAVAAFDIGAVDYLLKPVRAERLDEALRRIRAGRSPASRSEPDDDTIPVELGGVTRLVRCDSIGWVEADGDYARLHTSDGSHLVRVPLSTLEERWGPEGFVRIHRSHLVSIGHILQIRTDGGRVTVEVVGGDVLQVSRRHTRELRDRLIRQVRPGRDDPQRP